MTFRVQEKFVFNRKHSQFSWKGTFLFYDWNQIVKGPRTVTLGKYLFCCGYNPVSVLG